MRTTLDIDGDVLSAVKELAASQRRTAGKVISELARRGLQATREGLPGPVRNGFELLDACDEVVTVELVDTLIEEDL